MSSIRNVAVAASVVASLVLAACGGGGGGSSTALPNSQGASSPIAPYQGPSSLASFAWGKGLMQNATYVAPVSEQAALQMNVLVAQRDAQGLIDYAKSVSDPTSPNYRNFLTPTQIADRFGASQADYSKTADYFKQYGIHVSGWPQRQLLAITGQVSALETALGTKFAMYKAGSQTFIGPMSAPHLTTAQPISAIGGLVHAQLATTMLARPSDGQLRGYSPQQMQRAFDYSGAISKGFDGTGINVAIVGTGPISSADAARGLGIAAQRAERGILFNEGAVPAGMSRTYRRM